MLLVNDLGDRLKAFTNSMTGNCGTVQVLNCSSVVLRVLSGTALHFTLRLLVLVWLSSNININIKHPYIHLKARRSIACTVLLYKATKNAGFSALLLYAPIPG